MFTTFAPSAIHSATYFLFPPRQPGRRRWFLFGGIGFWLVIGMFVMTYMAMKFLLWLLVIAAICAAQLVAWLVQLVWWPVLHGYIAAITWSAKRRTSRLGAR